MNQWSSLVPEKSFQRCHRRHCTFGITATKATKATNATNAANAIDTYRFGGERLAGFVDQRFAAVVSRGAATLRQDIRANLIGSQQRVSGYYFKGVNCGTNRAENVVGVVVDQATHGESLVAANAVCIDRAANLNALAR